MRETNVFGHSVQTPNIKGQSAVAWGHKYPSVLWKSQTFPPFLSIVEGPQKST